MAAEFNSHPFLLPVNEVADVLGTDIEKGLASAEVTRLSEKYPPNVLDVGEGIAWYTIFFRQLFNAMILVSPSTKHPVEHVTNQHTGPILRHGSQLWRRRLHRRQRPGRSHHPKRRDRFLPGVRSREEDGRSPCSIITQRFSHPPWQECRHPKVSFPQ